MVRLDARGRTEAGRAAYSGMNQAVLPAVREMLITRVRAG